MMQLANEGLWMLKDVAKKLAISERTAWSLADKGLIPSVVISSGRRNKLRRFDPAAISEWIKKGGLSNG